jgi:hypothetical protein
MRITNFENKKCYSISNENDLQLEVVKLLRKSGLLFSCSHTTEMLDTDGKRIDAKKQGYTVGMPDIMVYSGKSTFSGMAIELKNTWGTGELSSQQKKVMTELEVNNWLIFVSNDLVEIAEIILLYKNGLIERELIVQDGDED